MCVHVDPVHGLYKESIEIFIMKSRIILNTYLPSFIYHIWTAIFFIPWNGFQIHDTNHTCQIMDVNGDLSCILNLWEKEFKRVFLHCISHQLIYKSRKSYGCTLTWALSVKHRFASSVKAKAKFTAEFSRINDHHLTGILASHLTSVAVGWN